MYILSRKPRILYHVNNKYLKYICLMAGCDLFKLMCKSLPTTHESFDSIIHHNIVLYGLYESNFPPYLGSPEV